MQNYVPSWLVRASDINKGVTPIQLPLPKFFVDPDESADDMQPRAFYHVKDLKEEGAWKEKDVCLPRCGMSGLFFSREELIDNLCAAAKDLKYSSPFWIKEDYELLQSGYLELKDGSDAVVVGLTASVAGTDVIRSINSSFLHSSLKKYVSSSGLQVKSVGKDVPLGMNAITGFVSPNSELQSFPHRGLWMSYEQLLQLSTDASATLLEDQFTLVEVDQWSLYNADQLAVPGKLGLKKRKDSEGIFIPL